MATIRQRGKKWQAEVYRLGQRRAKSFDSKSAAKYWASRTEAELTERHGKGDFADGAGRTMATLFDRYLDEVTPGKRGAHWEALRINAFKRDALASVALSTVAAPDIAAWRDRRLAAVSTASVLREMNIMTAICNRAVKEWQWLPANPCSGVFRPKDSAPRERVITDDEIAAIAHVCAFELDGAQQAVTVMQRVAAAFLFAIETAMRAGEICGLTAADITGSVARLDMTKNGYGRNVPLSPAALAILARLPATKGPLFGLSAQRLDAMFRKVRDMAGIEGLHFHDTRHTAVTNLARKLDLLDLARMTGHRDLKMLGRYYHRSASDVAAQLATPR